MFLPPKSSYLVQRPLYEKNSKIKRITRIYSFLLPENWFDVQSVNDYCLFDTLRTYLIHLNIQYIAGWHSSLCDFGVGGKLSSGVILPGLSSPTTSRNAGRNVMEFHACPYICRNWRVIQRITYLSALDFGDLVCIYCMFFCVNIANVVLYTNKIVNHSRHVDG